MSEVAASSENQENCVQAKNDEVVEPVPANNSILNEASSEVVETTSTPADASAAEEDVGATPPIENAAEVAATSPKVENKKTPVKRTPSKRMSFIERAQKESEELVKNLGGSLELEGGRRTRSSTRGTPTRSAVVATPPPAKKSRASPAASSSAATTPSRRGRGRKIDTSSDPADVETATEENKKTEAAEEATSEKAADDNNDAEKSSVENAENSVVDAANTAAAAEEQEASGTVKTNDENKTNATAASKSEDIADAALDSIPEEKQNNIDHNVSEERKNDSPMDTDEDPKSVSEPESTVAATAVEELKEKKEPTKAATISLAAKTLSSAAEATASVEAIEKQPTPEPMEVDSSSSKDNEEDIESAPNNADNVGKDIPTDSSKASSVEIAVTLNAAKTHKTAECEPSSVVVTNAVEDKPSNAGTNRDSVSEPVVEKHNAEPALVKDLKIAVTADGDPSAAGEPQATTNATLETTSDTTTKPENDLCEPKIVSPPTSDGAVAATPQYCN